MSTGRQRSVGGGPACAVSTSTRSLARLRDSCAAIAAGERDEHRPAAIRRRRPGLRGQHLHPQLGPAAGQLRGDRARGRVLTGGQRRGVGPLDLVRDQQVPLPLRQPLQRLAQQRATLLYQQLVLRGGRAAGVGEQVRLVPVPFLSLQVGGYEVARGDDRVRHQRLLLQPGPGAHDPGQRLLDQIVDEVCVPQPGSDDAADHRQQVEDRLVLLAGGNSAVLSHERLLTHPALGRCPQDPPLGGGSSA